MKRIIRIQHFAVGKTVTANRKPNLPFMHSIALLMATVVVLAVTGCEKNNEEEKNTVDRYTGLAAPVVNELKEVQTATARYKDLQNAITDGYTDINVVVQHMGFHYMKAPLADSVFDYRKPEILVYNKNHRGQVELVAVEYAIPIPLRPNEAPEGFTGTADVWKRDTGFNLWLLHAWVWAYNPDGVFNPTNPLVKLH